MVLRDKQLLIISGNIEIATGGVAMHVHRLLKQFIEPNISNYKLCDYKKEGIIPQLIKIRKADVMHIHASNPYLKLFYVIVGKVLGTKSLITLHGRYGIYGKWRNLLNKWALKYCDVPILINKESFEEVKTFNLDAVFIPAFIPPIKEEEQLPLEIKKVIKDLKKGNPPLFITNASSRAFTDDGREIYGIEFLISFFSYRADYTLLILDPRGEYEKLFKNRLPNNVTIISGKLSFCGVIEMSDAVIRNTPIDGDSFSVKEALYYHKRILATDVVSRPQGVFMFKYNDAQSLESAIHQALSYNGVINSVEENTLPQYLRLYSLYGVNAD